MGLGYTAARRLALKYEREGIIERTSRRPGLYRWKRPELHPINAVRQFAPETPQIPQETPLLLPKRFGATFFLHGRAAVKYNAQGRFIDKNVMRTLILGRHKLVIYLHSFVGETVEKINQFGQQVIMGLAEATAQKYGVACNLDRFFYDVEWVVVSETDGLNMAKATGIEEGGAFECAGAIHKFDDFTDPDHWQFNPLRGGDPQRPTGHAKIHERIYSGQFDRELVGLFDVVNKLYGVVEMEKQGLRTAVSCSDMERQNVKAEGGLSGTESAKDGKVQENGGAALLLRGGPSPCFTEVVFAGERAQAHISRSNWARWARSWTSGGWC
jgi:hypothetical protein